MLYTSPAWQHRLQGWGGVNKREQLHRRASAGVAGSGVGSRVRACSAADGVERPGSAKCVPTATE